MSIEDVVTIQITSEGAGVTRAGFGVPLILSQSATWIERTRSYTTLAGVEADFATTTPEYKAAAAMLAQNPRPPRIMIGRAANQATQVHTITVASAAFSTVYKLYVNGTAVSVTSDGDDDNDDIVGKLVTAINAVADNTYTAAATGSEGSQIVTITADSAAVFNGFAVDDPARLLLAETEADPGIKDDLTAINNEDSSWYGLVTIYNSSAIIDKAAEWVESNFKLYTPRSSDTQIITVASASATDIAESVKDDALGRTHVIYHHDSGSFADARLMGALFPYTPGSETWAFKTLSGLSPTTLTGTHKTNLKAKRAGYYITLGGLNITQGGLVGGNEWIDVVRLVDWTRARTGEAVLSLLTTMAKVPYTDEGAALIQGAILGVLKEGVQNGGYAADPAPVCTVPAVADVSSGDRAARILPDVNFSATLAGAVHSAEVTGVVSV